MIDVRVCVDHGHDGFPRSVLVVQIERGASRFRGDQRVVDRDALLSLNNGQVRQVRPTHLVDTGNHFIQAGIHQQLRHTPETRVDGVGRGRTILNETGVPREVPHDLATLILDDAVVWQPCNQAALGICEIRLVRPSE